MLLRILSVLLNKSTKYDGENVLFTKEYSYEDGVLKVLNNEYDNYTDFVAYGSDGNVLKVRTYVDGSGEFYENGVLTESPNRGLMKWIRNIEEFILE